MIDNEAIVKELELNVTQIFRDNDINNWENLCTYDSVMLQLDNTVRTMLVKVFNEYAYGYIELTCYIFLMIFFFYISKFNKVVFTIPEMLGGIIEKEEINPIYYIGLFFKYLIYARILHLAFYVLFG